jgi:hypothetical protein
MERTRLTLTPAAILKLAELQPALLPGLSRGNIEDKSKADGLAKTIVCVQALWYVTPHLTSFLDHMAEHGFTLRFLAQTVGRLATGNPISLLEMNTLLHALCCFVIYAAWWHKPFDIAEPSLVDVTSPKNKQLAACMLMGSDLGCLPLSIHHDQGGKFPSCQISQLGRTLRSIWRQRAF